MATVSTIREHIEITPGTCGGKPRIAGTRIRVQDIVIWHDRMGMGPDEIVTDYPHLTLSDVYAALAYYHDHLEEVRGFLREEEEIAAELEAQQPSIIEKIMTRRHAPRESDPVAPGRELPPESRPRAS